MRRLAHGTRWPARPHSWAGQVMMMDATAHWTMTPSAGLDPGRDPGGRRDLLKPTPGRANPGRVVVAQGGQGAGIEAAA